MFRALGRSITRHPLAFVLFWLLLLAIGGVSALWGFGHGNLFSRMESGESMVPSSESDIVNAAMSGQEAGESLQIIVQGVSPSTIEKPLRTLTDNLRSIDGVDAITTPVTISDDVKQAREDAISAAVTQALNANSEQTALAVQGALAQAEPQLSMLPPAMRAQQERTIEQQAQAAAEEAITQEATAAVNESFDQMGNPAEKFQARNGFAMALTLKAPSLAQADKQAYIARVHDEVLAEVDSFVESVRDEHPDAARYAASTTIYKDLILGQVATDLVRGEIIGLPLALILLLIVFGGAIAAGMPIGSALAAIATGMGIMWGVTFITNVDSFVLNILSIIGLSLSIDYGLLVVSRYREQISKGLQAQGLPPDGTQLPENTKLLVHTAIEETVATAGRTVCFSALTIACAISGLFVMEAPMLQMIAAGGVTVTLLAVLTALTLIPAFITLAGAKLVHPSKLTKFKPFGQLVHLFGDASTDTGFFSRLGHWVIERPIRVFVTGIVILLACAAPIATLSMRSNFIEYVPSDSSAQKAVSIIDEDYPDLQIPEGIVLARTAPDNVNTLVDFIESTDGVTRVADPVEIEGEGTLITFYMDDIDDPVGDEATRAVEYLRGLDIFDYEVLVGGSAALQLDFNNSIKEGAPWALLIIVCSVLILVFLMTGSVIAPVTALLINSLSLLAGMGLGTLIFENGLFGIEPVSGLETMVVACGATFGFGLAMDYEMFLLARIKEFWDDGEHNNIAVVQGLQRSGRIITAAAAIIIAVFVGFVFGELLPIREIGVVLAIIVIVDASLVRMLLVPATMSMLHKWNWWAPKPLARIYEKIGLKE